MEKFLGQQAVVIWIAASAIWELGLGSGGIDTIQHEYLNIKFHKNTNLFGKTQEKFFFLIVGVFCDVWVSQNFMEICSSGGIIVGDFLVGRNLNEW